MSESSLVKNRLLVCPDSKCCFSTYSQHYYERHVSQHHPSLVQMFTCSICNERFWIAKSLERHIERKHTSLLLDDEASSESDQWDEALPIDTEEIQDNTTEVFVMDQGEDDAVINPSVPSVNPMFDTNLYQVGDYVDGLALLTLQQENRLSYKAI